MLARTEVGSKEHILSWLEAKKTKLRVKKEAGTYVWLSGECPAAQYSREFGDENIGLNLALINDLAKIQPHTWGGLHDRFAIH